MYIVHNVSGYGGVARSIISKVNYLADTFGNDVTLVVFHRYGEFLYKVSNKVRVINMDLNPYSAKNAQRLWVALKLRRRIKQAIDYIKPDIIVSLATCKETAWISKLKDASHKVLEVHGNYHFVMERKGLRGRLARNVVRKNIRHSDSFVVLTERDAELYRSHKIASPTVIANPLPFTPTSVDLQRKQKIVIAVGRLDYEKDFSALLRIWAKVSKKHPDWKLRILGDGRLKETLLHQAKDLGISYAVEITYKADMTAEYETASIQALTSLYEGLPMVLIEGSAYGIPAVAFNIDCGPSDVINDGVSGFLISDRNEDSFAEKLSLLIEDNELRRKFAEAAIVESKKFDINRVMNQWGNLFNAFFEG